MTRLKSLPLAIGAIVVSAGTVLGFAALPSAAAPGLANAASHSGKTVPARPADPGAPSGKTVTVHVAATAQATDAVTADAPTGNHGAVVSAVAKATDATPATNHGADVSAVAKANHGQTVAAAHRPAGAGKPVEPGKPADPGKR